ncbi:MAG: hypothetical protein ACJ72N_27350 [Labedaea sp.]
MTATLNLSQLRGSTTPRLWTPPLVGQLTPETSMGFKWVRWAREGLRRPPDPWQEWLWLHAGELLPDGRPRFRIVLVIVARQNGKTETPVILSTYWQFVEKVPLILGTSSKLDYAKESWTKAVKLVEETPQLTKHRPARWTRDANGEQESWTLPSAKHGSRYKIAAANKDAGRSLTVKRLIMDELRQHEDYIAWDAAEPTTRAVRDAQIWCLSNAGTDKSIVLNDLRGAALEYIKTGEGDPRLGLFEWSAPEGSDPEDIDALLQANPNAGYRIDLEDLLATARRSKRLGGKALAGFMTESMCLTVPKASEEPSAVDLERWAQLRDPASQAGPDVTLVVDVAPGRRSASIGVFSLRGDGRGHVEVVAHRPGTQWVIPALVNLCALHDPVAVAIDSKSALEGPLKAVGIEPPENPEEPARGDLFILGPSDVATAWGEFVDAISPEADAIRHIGQLPLEAAVSSSRTRELGDAEALARRKSAGDITPLVSVVHARYVFFQRAAILQAPEIDPGAWYL